jgi:hypothetical protein
VMAHGIDIYNAVYMSNSRSSNNVPELEILANINFRRSK